MTIIIMYSLVYNIIMLKGEGRGLGYKVWQYEMLCVQTSILFMVFCMVHECAESSRQVLSKLWMCLFQTIISWTILRVVTIAMSALVVSLFSVLLLVVTSPLTSAGPTGTKCPTAPGRPETCVCQAKDGIIDMTPLSNTNGTARSSKISYS